MIYGHDAGLREIRLIECCFVLPSTLFQLYHGNDSYSMYFLYFTLILKYFAKRYFQEKTSTLSKH